jgi:hypothetical protein
MSNLPEDGLKEIHRRIGQTWDRAQGHWTQFLLLSEPVDDSKQPSIAQIQLGTKQIALNFKQIIDKQLYDCIEALLAHEIGHHVRYPATLAIQARLRLLEKSLIPIENYSLINLFTDFMINAHLGSELKDQFVRIYRSYDVHANWQRDPAFLFYLSAYEELWRLNPGELMGEALGEFENDYPNYRAESQLLAQNIFGLGPNMYTQFVYFMSVLSRYIPPPQDVELLSLNPYQCGHGEPSPEDWADALMPTQRELEAIERALREGWLREVDANRMNNHDILERRIAGLPGQGTPNAEKVPDIMAAYYRQQAERYLLKPPSQRTMGEAIVPTTIEEWEAGDAVRDIDWLTTLLQRGDLLGAMQPMKRTRIAEFEGHDVPLWQPRMEIYLDVSGSMPDPRTTRNAMTLAAQILSTGAIRANGWVRALIYSHDYVMYWQWCRSEIEISRFLMHYVGGGTVFPFPVLDRSVQDCGSNQPIRVIISDRDFDFNYSSNPKHATIFADAAHRSAHLVLLQHLPDAECMKKYRGVGAKVVAVEDMEEYPKMAAALSWALFEDKKDGISGLVS